MNNIKELIDMAECLCEGYRDMPSGCESCPLFNLEEYLKDEERWECSLQEVIDTIKI